MYFLSFNENSKNEKKRKKRKKNNPAIVKVYYFAAKSFALSLHLIQQKSCSCTWNILCLASKIMWKRHWREREKLFLYIYKVFYMMSDISLCIMLYVFALSFFHLLLFVIIYFLWHSFVGIFFNIYYYAINSKLDEWKHFQYYIKH